jgi:hypothetical protein
MNVFDFRDRVVSHSWIDANRVDFANALVPVIDRGGMCVASS